MSTGLGPVILGVSMRFQKELRVREEIVIESVTISYQQKIGKMSQTIIRGDVVCCTAEFTFGLFNLKDRKLVMPTPEWLNALGINQN